MDDSTVRQLPVGSILNNRYRITGFLGEGGLAYIYQACRIDNPRYPVVIKQTKRIQELTGEISEDRFQMEREYRLLTELDHPLIPKALEMFEIDRVLYFVREYRVGTVLDSLIKEGIPERRIESLSWQILDILEYLHDNGIIYRDLKPSNIIVGSNGEVCLFDFGTARFFKQGKKGDTIALGTPGFAAPEQYGRAQTTEASDIYSFGAVLYYMLTKENPEENPFAFGEEQNLRKKIDNTCLASLLTACLEMDAEKRFQKITDLRKELYSDSAFSLPQPIPRAGISNPRTSSPAKLPPVKTRISAVILLILIFGFPFITGAISHFRQKQYTRKTKADLSFLESIPETPGKNSYNENLYWNHLEQARNLVSTGNEEKALEHLTSAVSINPKSDEGYYRRARILISREKYSEGLRDLDRAIEMNPKNQKALHLRGKVLQKKGKHHQAILDFTHARKSTGDSSVLKKLGNGELGKLKDNPGKELE